MVGRREQPGGERSLQVRESTLSVPAPFLWRAAPVVQTACVPKACLYILCLHLRRHFYVDTVFPVMAGVPGGPHRATRGHRSVILRVDRVPFTHTYTHASAHTHTHAHSLTSQQLRLWEDHYSPEMPHDYIRIWWFQARQLPHATVFNMLRRHFPHTSQRFFWGFPPSL